MDFVTICYNNILDLKLLEIQAKSFKYINLELVNNILIVFNDNNGEELIKFNQYFEETLLYLYPDDLKNFIKIVSKKDLNINCKNNWTSQQLLKLLISEFVETEYYISFDSKNHFVDSVDDNIFFENNKPKLMYGSKTHLNHKFIHSLSEFNVNDDTCKKYIDKEKHEFCTLTPFVFKTSYVKELMSEFPDFSFYFLYNSNITEFFIYISYMIKKKYIECYHISDDRYYFTIFNKNNICDIKYKIMGLHSLFIVSEANYESSKIEHIYKNTLFSEKLYDLFRVEKKKDSLYFCLLN